MSDTPRIVSGSDYLKLPRSPETWLVEGLLPVGGGMLLFGDPKVGKSYAALQLACCLTSGVEWLGFEVPKPTQVVYIQLDTPRSLWAERVEKLARAGHPVEAVHFADRETLGTYPFDILNPEHFRLLTESLAALKPGVVVLDTIREGHSGDENDSTAMQSVIAHLDAAVKPAAMVLIAHARKSNPEYGYDLMNDNRGSNYIVGRMDAIVRFSERSIRLTSRTLEEHSVKLERAEDGTWDLGVDDVHLLADRLIEENPGLSTRELARLMRDRINKSEHSCRGVLRRRLAKVGLQKHA